jgi:methylglutaconyl-CoA hydratase
MNGELVHFQSENGTAVVTLASPHNRNALSHQLRVELLGHLDRALADDDVRVVVLTHDGPVFSSGADLKEVAASAGEITTDPAPLSAILDRLWHSPKPIVARLAGPARAGGLGVVAACDVVVAAEEVTFSFTEVRIGVVPAVISAVVLPRCSYAAVHELMLTGEVFSGQRAVEIGLINRVVQAERLGQEVERISTMLARGGPQALAGTKALLREGRPANLTAELGRLLELSAGYFGSEEAAEGIRSFREKRTAAWVPQKPVDASEKR